MQPRYECRFLSYLDPADSDKEKLALLRLAQKMRDELAKYPPKFRLAQYELMLRGDRFIVVGRS